MQTITVHRGRILTFTNERSVFHSPTLNEDPTVSRQLESGKHSINIPQSYVNDLSGRMIENEEDWLSNEDDFETSA
tara:strand:+ start:1497 stop:1724 length:228 start_codon:yes stop_codon:yes gene_type:complete